MSAFKVGDKCRLHDDFMDGLHEALDVFLPHPARWEVVDIVDGKPCMRFDGPEIRLHLEPLDARHASAWTEQDEADLIEWRQEEAASNMPANLGNLRIDIEDAIGDAELLGLDASKLRAALALVDEQMETFGMPPELWEKWKAEGLV